MNRRDLLKGAAGLAAWSTFWTAHAADAAPNATPADADAIPTGAAPGSEQRKGDMLYRKFGKTNEMVSAIGLGGYHIGKIKEEQESIKLIRTAIDRGITFMDNCWDYHDGKSEVWMGNALKDGYRDKVFLMTKLDGRKRSSAMRQIDESLKRLQTDRIDLMQIHEILRLEDPDVCFADEGAVKALEDAQKAGKIRFTGFTGHKDPIAHNRMLDVADKHGYHFDAVQMPLNPLDGNFRSFAQETLPRLVKSQIAVLGMKSVASGAIVKNKIATPQECIRYALTLPTTVVIAGMETMEILEQNLAIAKDFKPMSREELTTLLARTEKAADTGQYEAFKTGTDYDGTAHNPHWLGYKG